MVIDNSSLYRSSEGYLTTMSHYEATLSSWPVPKRSIYVSTRHGETHVLIAGNPGAPPLFIFHGWGGDAAGASQEYDLSLLGERYRLYIPDTIGQRGRSAPSRPPTDGAAYGEWIADMFDELEVESTNVVGISGGGYLSLKIASHAPERVRKALIMSTAGMVSPAVSWRLLLVVPVVIYPSMKTVRWFLRALSSPTTKPELMEDFAISIYLMFKHHRYDRTVPAPLSDDELHRITAPVLILMGKHDASWNVTRLAERARAHMANVQVDLVENAGHVMTIERPGMAEKRMIGFFGAD